MASMILDPQLERDLLAQRALTGADRYDEVWEGITMMSPLANNQHQWLATRLAFVFEMQLESESALVFAGCNISDREENWADNYRCPDVAVFLAGCTSRDRGTHWLGGPNLAVEITSPGDRTRDKIEFYGRVGVEELLIVDRAPWQLEIYRSQESDGLVLAEKAQPAQGSLHSQTTRLKFSLLPTQTERPSLLVESTQDDRLWKL